jgi:hypothetical protein
MSTVCVQSNNKSQGHDVRLLNNYQELNMLDQIYISKVFNYTQIPGEVIALPNVIIGGTGFYEDGGKNLPDEVEHHMPDYKLYEDYAKGEIAKGRKRSAVEDYLDYSIGFTTRGCFRKCSFCVNKKYDKAIKHSPVKEFYDPARPYIYLWDDNFLAYSGWEAIIDELEATGKPFQFRQGLDLRLMTDKMAKRLSNTHYHGDFIFAFDHLEDKELIEEKLKLWKRYCGKIDKLYVLCAYKSQDEKDIRDTFERIGIIMKYGCLPYIMRYESYKQSRWGTFYTQIARWCNQPQFFKKKSFRQFCEANQDYHKNTETICTAYQIMMDFEKEFPDIAKEYFDLRYDEENQYGNSYGFSRKYANKLSCKTCKEQQLSWEEAYMGEMPINVVIEKYFQKEIDLQCFTYPEIACYRYSKETIAEWFCGELLNVSLDCIFDAVTRNPAMEEVLPSNIPQFSDFADAYIETPKILESSNEKMTYDQLGVYLDNGKNKKEGAQRKYGENHSKVAALLDLAVIATSNNIYKINTSVFGVAYNKRNEHEKKAITARLLFRIPIIQKMLIDALVCKVDIENELSCLSKQTRMRRKPNIATMLQYLFDDMSDGDAMLGKALNNIKGWR